MLSFFFNDTATTEIYTLSLHDALPIFRRLRRRRGEDHRAGLQPRRGEARALGGPAPRWRGAPARALEGARSEEHTSELQSRRDLVCRLLLEKKKKKKK